MIPPLPRPRRITIALAAVRELREARTARARVLALTPPDQWDRVRALMAMPPPTTAEVAQMVGDFFARQAPTLCPTANVAGGDADLTEVVERWRIT